MVDNSIDEALAGHCTSDVFINEDNSITVQDNGRDVPTDMHPKEKKSALEVVMTVLHAGGKFDKDSYKVSGGLHGVGVSCVNALTHLKATGTVMENARARVFAWYSTVRCKRSWTTDITGTEVTFKPDDEIFIDTVYRFDILQARLRELSFLNKGIPFLR